MAACDGVVSLLCQGHAFCFRCINSWTKRSNHCPTCRAVVKKIVKTLAPGEVEVEEDRRKVSTLYRCGSYISTYRCLEIILAGFFICFWGGGCFSARVCEDVVQSCDENYGGETLPFVRVSRAGQVASWLWRSECPPKVSISGGLKFGMATIGGCLTGEKPWGCECCSSFARRRLFGAFVAHFLFRTSARMVGRAHMQTFLNADRLLEPSCACRTMPLKTLNDRRRDVGWAGKKRVSRKLARFKKSVRLPLWPSLCAPRPLSAVAAVAVVV